VLAHDPDPPEPGLLVAADRALVLGGRVDHEPVVATVGDEVPRHRPDRVRAEPAAVMGLAEEEVDAGVLVVGVGLLVVLDQPRHLTLGEDREAGHPLVLAARLLADVLRRQAGPPAGDVGMRAELDDPVDVGLAERAQDDTIAAQFHDGPVTHRATTLRP
jgi:hypothetical protein